MSEPELREACGLFGMWGDPEAAERTYFGIFALQHRGQESAGIASVTAGGLLRRHRGMGLVQSVFQGDVLQRLASTATVGHTRYSTTGASLLANAQPLVANTRYGSFAVAHNGNLVNGPALRAEFEAKGSIFQTTSDSEVVLHLLASPDGPEDPVERVKFACARLEGAFSLLILTPTFLAGVRDPQGLRPLWLGRRPGGAHVFSSETPAFDITGTEPLAEVSPGTVTVLDDAGHRELRYAEAKPAHCMFEHVYFARPDGILFGDSIQQARIAMGRALAREHPVEADLVIAIPDSGNEAALGYHEESKIPLGHGFIRNHYVGRTFIQPTQASRTLAADLKLNVVRPAVAGKRVVVVDDSVVRGTTARRRCRYLREAGATEVHLRVSCPPIKHPCFYGIDFQSKGELMAAVHSLEEIRALLEVDSVGYLSVEGLLAAVSGDPGNYCTACWTGSYPVPIPAGVGKKSSGEMPGEAL